jgi:Fe-S oxidoreductase
VDVGRFKSEFLASYWEQHGLPLAARALGTIGTTARWGSRLAPIANRVLRSGPGRRMAESLLGIDRRRRLPEFARRTLRARVTSPGDSPDVILFADTFTNHYDPEIGTSALEVLAAAGVRGGLAAHACCGRPQISKGLLADARALAEHNVASLYPHADAGRPLLFCEPSCLSAIREDAPALVRGETRRRAETVARASVLFEEFLDPLGARLPLRAGPSRILLHGHCHQKSMGLLAPARRLLERVPRATVVDLDAGCCGMAGSFGYTRDHYDVSRAIGERRLFPAVRGAGPDDAVVAAGTSCRHQVKDFTGVEPVHPAVLLRSLLERASA